jgi:hypothetical protein
VSYGCIRMRSADVIDLYSRVGEGARVEVRNAPLHEIVLPDLRPEFGSSNEEEPEPEPIRSGGERQRLVLPAGLGN